jgi:hypothetical protein
VGVIVYSKGHRYLRARIELDEARLRALDSQADLAAVHAALRAFEKACTEGPLVYRAAEHNRPAGSRAQPPHRRSGGGTHPPLRHAGPGLTIAGDGR